MKYFIYATSQTNQVQPIANFQPVLQICKSMSLLLNVFGRTVTQATSSTMVCFVFILVVSPAEDSPLDLGFSLNAGE